MRIGLTGGATSTQKLLEQAVRAEQRGFTSLWYASSVFDGAHWSAHSADRMAPGGSRDERVASLRRTTDLLAGLAG